jgi:putative phage-type endonuclease
VPITEAQLQMRMKHIGSSDAAAILGLSPWKTPNDIFWSKRPDLVVPGIEAEPEKASSAITAGNYLEDSIIQFAADDLQVQVIKNQFRVSKGRDKGVLSATVDALVANKPEAIEAKTTGITYFAGREALDSWGEPDTCEVPDHYLVQCHHQITVLDLERVWLYALIGGRGFVRYRVDKNAQVSEALIDQLLDWWNAHVVPGVPPDPSALPPRDLVRSIRPQEGKIITLDNDALRLVEEWEIAKADAKTQEKLADDAKLRVEMLLGDASLGVLPDGRQIKKVIEERTYFDKDAAMIAHPDVIAAFTTKKPNNNPTMRLIKAKKEK